MTNDELEKMALDFISTWQKKIKPGCGKLYVDILEKLRTVRDSVVQERDEYEKLAEQWMADYDKLKDSAECEKYVVGKLTEEIVDLKKERDLYRNALGAWERTTFCTQECFNDSDGDGHELREIAMKLMKEALTEGAKIRGEE